MTWRGYRHQRDRGMATAELAIVIPAVVVVLALLLSGVMLAIDQVRCTDAARVAARAVARGESTTTAHGIAQALAPAGTEIAISLSGEQVTVTLTGPARAPLPLRSGGRAVGYLEPGAVP